MDIYLRVLSITFSNIAPSIKNNFDYLLMGSAINVNWSDSALASFRFRDSVSFQGKNIRLLRVNIKNKTTQPIQLNERVFWVPQTMAIAFNPTVNTLRPHEQVTLFLLIKEKPE